MLPTELRYYLCLVSMILVVRSERSDNFFVLAINFPTYFEAMREMLFKHRNEEGVKVHCASINGFSMLPPVFLYDECTRKWTLYVSSETALKFSLRCHTNVSFEPGSWES